MSISLPFKGVRIPVPFGVISENNKYRVCIGEHRTEALPFKASLLSCFEDIQRNAKTVVMKHPKYLELVPYSPDANTVKEDQEELNPVNNDEFVTSFVQLWCEHWHINLQDLSNIAKLSRRKPEPFVGPTKPATITYINSSYNTAYNTIFNNGTGGISYITTTSNTTSPYYSQINNADQLDITIDTDVDINFMCMPPINMNDNDTFIAPERDSFNVRNINTDYQYMLTLNADKYNVGYIIKDLLKLPFEKVLYFKSQFNKIMDELKTDIHRLDMSMTPQFEKIPPHVSFSECTYESHYYIRLCGIMPSLLKNMYKSIPDHINEFPFDGFCYVPELSTKPKTRLQWALCNYIFKQDYASYCGSLINGISRSIRIKDATKKMLPYLNVTDKLLDDYCAYSNVIKPENPSLDWYETQFNGLLQLIQDGKKIYAMYPDAMEIEGLGTLKMSPIHGSLLRQLQNSIYNHRSEVKISLEQKLAVLLANDTNQDSLAEPVHKLSEALEAYRITKKSHLITLGKLLGHCIGTKTDLTNMFFRKDTVCAQVNENSLDILTCLDAKNKTTDASNAFRTELQELLYLLKKEMMLPSILELRGLTEEQLDADGHLKEIVEAEFKQKYYKSVKITGIVPEGLRNELARLHGVDVEQVLGEALQHDNFERNDLDDGLIYQERAAQQENQVPLIQRYQNEVAAEIDREVLGMAQGQVLNARVENEYRNRYMAQRANIGGVVDANYNGNITINNHNYANIAIG